MYKLLIADDESEIRNGLCNYYPWHDVGFECLGYVEDGLQAMEYLRTHEVDVVLSDIVMPKATGIDLARFVWQEGLSCRMVFLSGYQDFDYARRALEYGVRYYILKPTRYAEITDIFTRLRNEMDGSREQPAPAEEKDATASHAQIVRVIREYVEQNYRTASLGEAAKLVYLHPFYVSKVFKKETGQNFSDYLIEVKMKNAARMLSNPEIKAYEISEQVGYTSAKNFSRTFKTYFGVSPRDYKAGGIK